MIKYVLILLILNNCIVYSQKTTAEGYRVKKSTLNTVSSLNIPNFLNTYYVLQSAGQNRIIGTKSKNSLIVQQGFLNNGIYFNIDNSNSSFINEKLNFVISPNPFKDKISINFSVKTRYDISIRLFDVNGKILLSKKYDPTNKIILPLIPYSIGTYLIEIRSGKNSSSKKIIKIE